MTDRDIRTMTEHELTEFVILNGEPGYRAGQLYMWMHKRCARSFDEMSNLPASFRANLKANSRMTSLTTVRTQVSAIDGTRKYLFALPDDNLIESVMLPYRFGNTVCVSSQAGCRMGCAFCASTLGGLKRNLTAAEMLDQVYAIANDTDERVSHVVVMGSGEPLENTDELLLFLRFLTDEKGQGISMRSVTVSTCGIVPEIRRLADIGVRFTLAVSLHAPTQEKRASIMPVARHYSLDDVMDAADYYFARTGRQVTYEYALIDSVNDTDDDMNDLIRLLAGRNATLNLIPVNAVRERGLKPPTPEKTGELKNKLEKNGINVTIRREMGADIDGACGQLRQRHLLEEGFNGP